MEANPGNTRSSGAGGGPNGAVPDERHADRRRHRMRRAAKFLPFVTVAAWIIMIWVPVLDSGHANGNESLRIVYTSIGSLPVDYTDPDPEAVFVWCCLLVCVLTAWLLRSLRIWSVAAVVLGIVMLALLITMIAEPPTVIWDGQDSQGRPTGGMEVGRPVAGSVLWAMGGLSLIAAGVCGFIGEWGRGRQGT